MIYFPKNALLIVLILAFIGCKEKAAPLNAKENIRQKIEMITNYGTMIIELYDETPLHRDNFINLANQHAYDSLLFHRVIKDFMIQGGDPESRKAKVNDSLGEGDAPYVVKAEFDAKLFHKKGVLAAAREDNPDRASSGMQFYIVQGKIFNDSLLDKAEVRINKENARMFLKKDQKNKPLLDALKIVVDAKNIESYNVLTDSILNLAKAEKDFKTYIIPEDQRKTYKSIGGTPHLDGNYTVFGEVIMGLEVLDSIARTETGPLDRPLKDVRILEVKVVE